MVYRESFDKPDSTTLGPDLSWTEISNDLQVVSNRARCVNLNVNSYARADAAVAGSDMYARMTVTTFPATGAGTTNRAAGVCARCDASGAVTFYMARVIHLLASGFNYQLFKLVAAAPTQLGSNVPVTLSLPEVIQIECLGSTIICRRNGVSVIAANDTAIPTGLRGGIRLFEFENVANTEIDSFEVGDVAYATALQYGVGV